jgi:hypothetical protein
MTEDVKSDDGQKQLTSLFELQLGAFPSQVFKHCGTTPGQGAGSGGVGCPGCPGCPGPGAGEGTGESPVGIGIPVPTHSVQIVDVDVRVTVESVLVV